MGKKIRTEAIDLLFDAILTLENKEECYTFFEDICTIKELQDMSQRLDVAKLLPISAVAVYREGEDVVLETDASYVGRGETALQALSDLKETVPAVIYLDTAEYLLVTEEAVPCVEELRQVLRPSVKVCVCQAAGRVKETVKYLEIHSNLPKLRHWNGGKYEHVEK